jgi:hypothetical protein
MITAEELVDPEENGAFLHTNTTLNVAFSGTHSLADSTTIV